MSNWHARTAAVRRHPALDALEADGAERRRLEDFCHDLAAWLAGAPRADLRALGRVVTAVGGRPLRDARSVCQDLPLLAMEAGARAAATLWPFLRNLPPVEPPEERPQEMSGEGGEAGAGAPDDQDAEEREDDEETDEGDAEDDADAPSEPERAEDDAHALLEALADGLSPEDEDLAELAAHLAAQAVPADALSDAVEPLAEAAWQGARDGEELARALEALVPGIGWGTAPGALHAAMGQRLERFASLLERLPELRDLVDRLGRLEGSAGRELDDLGGGEEVTGVRLAGEVRGALPSELALLADVATEDLFYQRLAEHRLVSLELSGAGTMGRAAPDRRGPILACIDTSGSMAGAPEAAAKALVLAVCRRALPQGRVVHLLLFGARDEATELRLRRGRGGLEHLLDFLALSFEGGTDFDTPLLRALERIRDEALRQADVLVVTDGYARAAPSVTDAVQAAKEASGLRVWSVVLGRGGEEGVAGFSDEVWRIDPAADEAGGLAVRIARSR